MKTRFLCFLVLLLVMYSCSPLKNCIPLSSKMVKDYSLGADTLSRIQYYSPIDHSIWLKPTIKSQGIETTKGELLIEKEDIIIAPGTKGVMIAPSDTGKSDTIKVRFDEDQSRYLIFKKNTDGNYSILEENGVVRYGDKYYSIEGWNKSDRWIKLYIQKKDVLKRKIPKGISVKK